MEFSFLIFQMWAKRLDGGRRRTFE